MEFHCRVATAGGQITEATYVAENEARLRSDLAEKGLFVLAVQGKGGVKIGGLQLRLPKRRKIPMSEFLVFNQELATLLRAGLPLVQSLDILRRRAPNPVFKAALDDIYDKVRSGTALSEAFEAQHLFSGVYTASLLPIGSYEVVFELQGFQTVTMKNVTLHVNDRIRRYIVRLGRATRAPASVGRPALAEFLTLGISPRSYQHIFALARVAAFQHGRDHVLPRDVKEIFCDAARHRIVRSVRAQTEDVAADTILRDILNAVPIP